MVTRNFVISELSARSYFTFVYIYETEGDAIDFFLKLVLSCATYK
jgi:hypothetical protein